MAGPRAGQRHRHRDGDVRHAVLTTVRLVLAAIGLLLAVPAAAQQLATTPIATSPGPSSVVVTVYRAPDRASGDPINLSWLGGYALISETRTVTIPAGEADLRFEGVAGGIVPESAIVSGLPDGVREKNQDAYLLSPASLLDRSLGARVHLSRTSVETGAVREEDAVLRTGADGGVILQTARGFEALRCSGLPERVVYDRVPAGLSAKPTLSVRTQSARRTTATVTLSYLASGFDWDANYVGTLSSDGTRMDLFAWVTLANGDETGFVRAATQAVAGRVNREGPVRRDRPRVEPLRLTCYPLGTTTSDLPFDEGYVAEPPPPPPPVMMEMSVPVASIGEEIIVTGSRMMAKQEELGDLKLYRIPEPVTVAAMSQKQVALLDQKAVAVEQVFVAELFHHSEGESLPFQRRLRLRNDKASGLGLPLPAGSVTIFQSGAQRPLLVGKAPVRDTATDEVFELTMGASTGVRFVRKETGQVEVDGGKSRDRTFSLVVTNAGATPVRTEAEIVMYRDETFMDASAKLTRRDGQPVWIATIPANGRAELTYRVREPVR